MKGRIAKTLAALLISFANQIAAAASVTYIYTDPQGTPLAEADAHGIITATFDYGPYGSQVLGSEVNGPGYTGHISDSDTGFVYMQARYYDSKANRFISADPELPRAGNLFNFSRFAYANNNPVVNLDPSGRETGAGYGNGEYYAHYPTQRDIQWQNEYVKFFDARMDDVNQLVASNPDLAPLEAAGELIDYIDVAIGASKDSEIFAPLGASSDVPQFSNGEFSVSDWTGYPSDVPKPQGELRLISDSEYKAARSAANRSNSAYRQANGLVGQRVDVHEIQPVRFGGSPTDPYNKIVLPRDIHQKVVTPWWNQFQRDVSK